MTNMSLPRLVAETYEIKSLLGSGGMGDVYLAYDTRLDREVAIKFLKLSNATNEESIEYIERFKNEAKSVAKLNHPNIAGIYDIGSFNESDYMVMEYVEGENLHDIIQKETLSIKSVLKIAKQLCNVVDFIHEKGIIHRDIKSANILVNKNFEIKITDFGIAKNDSNEHMLTKAGSILGSIMYSPPEQFVNVKNLDKRSDIYSVGICIYEMLTGSPPFVEKNTIQEIILAIISETIVKPTILSDKIPALFDDILLKALEKVPEKRYQDIKDFMNDLEILEKSLILESTQNSSLLEYTTNSALNSALSAIRDTRMGSTFDLNNTTLNMKDFFKELHLDFHWLNKILNDSELNKFVVTNQEMSFKDFLSKIRAQDLNGRRFSGILTNENIYLFINQGVVTGAFDKSNRLFGDEVFNTIPENFIFTKIINTQENENFNLLLYSILSLDSEVIHENLNSAKINLFEVLDNLTSGEAKFCGYIVCQKSRSEKDKEKYLFALNQGEVVFNIKINDQLTVTADVSLEDFLKSDNNLISIYKPKLYIPQKELENLMQKSEFYLKYRDVIDGTLQDIADLGKEEVSHCLGESVKNNIIFDIVLKSSIKTITVMDKEIELKELITRSQFYKACLWIVTEFLFLINISGNISYFRDLYKSASEIVKFNILDELTGFYGCSNDYSIVAKDAEDKVIFLARFGDGSREDLESFMEETVLVKKNMQKHKKKELYSAFYISKNKLDNNTVACYYKNVKQEAGFFKKSKAYLKVGLTDGFNVILLQQNNEELSLVAPNLYN